MLTIFAIPKAFSGPIKIIQRNAIKSWIELGPECEVILFGNDPGVKDIAQKLGIKHIPDVEKNEFGTPLLSSAFNIAQRIAKNDILAYVNADIILFSDLIPAIKQINKPMYLMSGRRWDLDISQRIDFSDPYWEKKLFLEIFKRGKIHGYSAIDYFVFPRNLPHNLPEFAVGRIGWDNWLIYHLRSLKIPIIDATEVNKVIHQNHDFSHSPFKNEKKKRVEGPEMKKTFKIAGGLSNMLTLREADFILTSKEIKRPKFPRSVYSKLALFYPWRMMIGLKRKIQNLI